MADLNTFLREDLGRRGDVTTKALFGSRAPRAKAVIFSREDIVAAGLDEACKVFRLLGARARREVQDGSRAATGQTLVAVDGALDAILTGERLALNLIGRMSGIATLTRACVDRAHRVNPACAVAATRKTTPGFREYEKRAVVLGGGEPHRMGLYDGVLIKDNHLDALGDVASAVRRAKAARTRLPIEVEVSTVADAKAAAAAGADWILVDNLSPARARRVAQAARAANGAVRVEISGGLTEDNLHRYAPFADRLSLGRLTHSAPSADVTLQLRTPKR